MVRSLRRSKAPNTAGRDFYGIAKTASGVQLFFRSEIKVAPEERIQLGADPERVLVYSEVAQ